MEGIPCSLGAEVVLFLYVENLISPIAHLSFAGNQN
jgi:hypothetical protein